MKEITLTAIFEGTIYSIEQPNTHLHQVLFKDCEGVRITSAEQVDLYKGATHFKIGFNGCGVDYGVKGLLFGAGVKKQSDQVVEVVKKLIKEGHKVKLNCIGLSRGGIAAIMAAIKLAHVDGFHLETNLLLLDPVPGNLFYVPFLDFFNYTLTNNAIDLSGSKNLNYVETLYPYLEVGDDTEEWVDQVLAKFHIPIRPTYPKHCQVREEVILGAHLKAFQDVNKENDAVHLRYGVDVIPIIRKLSKAIMYQFLDRVGSLVEAEENIEQSEIINEFQREGAKWKRILAEIIASIIPKSRVLHSQDQSRITVSNSAKYLNKTHRELIDMDSHDPEELCLKVEPERNYLEKQNTPLTKMLLLDLIEFIHSKMTNTSRQSSKGRVLTKIKNGMEVENDDFFTEERLSFILRDILAVALQRDRYSYSFYSTTTSGLALVNALNQSKFSAIKELLQFDDKPIEYSDLTAYVLGRNDPSHFNSQDLSINFARVEEHSLGEDGYRMLV
ncbi:hypothetical protein [Fluoribacter gormanii]|uniref:Uncharacterized protein n=1 Tax=Fluoribacter gormanii TaxID=464 RepID=A0A377GKN9_9GAMM|nr:hypothetical protein [Fluoribacter gormanii]KTD04269.1 hypothetical protein Lgor_1037 [Fluoribacter gormanii]SIR74743.1 hypothetical protein SAMN05421777_12243 [Fluoribacter gormanii]STO25095.1 Uncharacterised protein [Fluoribacter gormanii]